MFYKKKYSSRTSCSLPFLSPPSLLLPLFPPLSLSLPFLFPSLSFVLPFFSFLPSFCAIQTADFVHYHCITTTNTKHHNITTTTKCTHHRLNHELDTSPLDTTLANDRRAVDVCSEVTLSSPPSMVSAWDLRDLDGLPPLPMGTALAAANP